MKKKFIRKLTKKSRYSYFLSVPKKLIKEFGWKERQKLILERASRKRIVVRDYKP